MTRIINHLYTIICLLAVATVATAQSSYDQNAPFGFATRTSRTNTSATYNYNVTGGGCYTYPVTGIDASKVITLKSTGKDQLSEIQNAIKNYSVIIFDGSNGEFVLSKTCSLGSLSNKTILGINNATLRSQWYLTDEMRALLDSKKVKSMSTASGTGGTLSNGSSVSEQAEYNVRQLLINFTGDSKESYRSAGVFSLSGCRNIIIRNIKFRGPGSVDISGADLISFTNSTKNCWVDHCEFADGTDGNFDITQKSDFNTVSWCRFSYTAHSYMHQNTNLVGSSDSETTGYLNTTFAFNHWAEGCNQRMPMARVGLIHMLNNYYTCTSSAATINPRKNSEFLIEGNYFAPGVNKHFGQTDAKAWTWKSDNYIGSGSSAPSSNGAVTVPYTYSKIESSLLPEVIGKYAGATLFGNEAADTNPPSDPSDIITPDDPSDKPSDNPSGDQEDKTQTSEGNTFVVTSTTTAADGKKIVCKNITMTYGNDGAWREAFYEGNGPDDHEYYIAGNNNPVNGGTRYSTSNKTLPTSGTYYVFNPTKDGTLKVAVEIYTNKQLFVTEGSTAINVDVNGKTLSPGGVANSTAPTFGYITFDVKADKTYYVFCISSKLMLFGFEFLTEADENDPTTDTGDNDPTTDTGDNDTPTNQPTDIAIAPTVPATAGTPLTFESNARYSKLVIDSRLNSFYANKNKVGFGEFNDKGEQTATEFATSSSLDYVPGLVAKAVIEAVDYYKDNTNVNVKPWYYAVQNYGCKYDIASNGKAGKSFDDLNAVKLYFKLQELAANKTFADGALYSNATTVSTSDKRFADALSGIVKADDTYSIKEGFDAAMGGWWHKSTYVNQMWCDGQYMGPALLAQMINGYKNYSAVASQGTDWDLVTKQFTICWNFLWDADQELLYHALSSTPTDAYAKTWADPATGRSKEYWGRAEGWYFLALVDVLEEMQKANLTATDNYKTLRKYLNKVAAGLAKRADAKTGCWYQLLQYDNTFYADSYNGASKTKTYNYLESSASAIFIAAYLKGQRLGLYDTNYLDVAKKAYKGFVETFIVSDGNGGVHLINSCRSAGLGGSSYRDGSAAYYLLGSDVSMVKASDNQTEGKVLGAFILAATEYERAFLATPTLLGDADDNGTVTLSDATLTTAHYLGKANRPINLINADVDRNGKVTISDANAIINIIRK